MLTRPPRLSASVYSNWHPSRAPDLLVDGQAQFLGGPLPRCVGSPFAVPDPRAFATASHGAFEFRVDVDTPAEVGTTITP